MVKRVEINAVAPDWTLADLNGRLVRLSDYRSHKHVLLVFNRGLT